MSEPFIGEIVMFAGNFAPRGWMLCQGQLLSIAQNTALFSILGTTYGGNGQTTFALPDLQGRVPVGNGNGAGLAPVVLGEVAGVQNVTLLAPNLPMHNHPTLQATATVSVAIPAIATDGSTGVPATDLVLAQSVETTIGGAVNIYAKGPATTTLEPFNATATMPAGQTGVAGGSQPFSVQNPFLGLNYIIAVQGIFPSRN